MQLLRSPYALGGVDEAGLDGCSPARRPLATQRGLAGLLGGAGVLRSDQPPMGEDHTAVAASSGRTSPLGSAVVLPLAALPCPRVSENWQLILQTLALRVRMPETSQPG